jgi:hypothetical protein
MLLNSWIDLVVKTSGHLHEVFTSNLYGWVHYCMYYVYTLILCTNVIYKHVHMVMVNGVNKKWKKNVIFFVACHEKL